MTAKFFDARLGVFVRMTNTPQSSIANKFTFNPNEYFYYKYTKLLNINILFSKNHHNDQIYCVLLELPTIDQI